MFAMYFEEMDHDYTTQNNKISMKLPEIELETGQKGFCFLGAKVCNGLLPEVRTIKFRTVFRKALDKHLE